MGAALEQLIPFLQKERDGVIRKFASDLDIEKYSEYRVIIEIDPDTISEYRSSQALFGSNTKVFLISSAVIADMTINNIYLTFYKGELIRFYTPDARDIAEAITAKYGPGHITRSYKPVICTYKVTGRKTKEQEGYEKTSWCNGDIETVKYVANKYDYNCQDSETMYFSITSARKFSEAIAINKAGTLNRDKRDTIKKSKRL
jgi:hypothetical protein